MEPYYLFRLRRWRRRWLRRVTVVWLQVRQFERAYIFSRTPHLRYVRRFMLSWLALMAVAIAGLVVQLHLLDHYYLVDRPGMGGAYIEGVVGEFGPLDPLFTDTPASNAASKLIFSGLFKRNGQGVIQPDLAAGYSVNSDGTIYTVRLKPNSLWQDGVPLTADDVAFTVQLIQAASVGSPLALSWRGASVQMLDGQTVQFHLPSTYAPFLNLLTVGLLPKHILGTVATPELKVSLFNQLPVGSGPFSFDHFSVDKTQLFLHANPNYVSGTPNIKRFVIKTYTDYGGLAKALSGGDVNGVGGFGVEQVASFSQIKAAKLYQWPEDNETLAFFNTTRPLMADRKLRQALTGSVNLQAIVAALSHKVEAARGPLLPDQLGYDPKLTQLTYNLEAAKAKLTADGWLPGPDGGRTKKGKPLNLTLVTQNSGIYPLVARLLQSQWQAAGVQVNLQLDSLDQLEQNEIKNRDYDILVSEVSLGSDPDVYAFWHSSQAGFPGLNLSDYKSSLAVEALEAGRTRLASDIRAAKYHTFLQVWRSDAPAVVLFRPYYFYATRGLLNVDVTKLSEQLDRFYNVANWAVKNVPILKRLVE